MWKGGNKILTQYVEAKRRSREIKDPSRRKYNPGNKIKFYLVRVLLYGGFDKVHL